jgi:hypothetical protein
MLLWGRARWGGGGSADKGIDSTQFHCFTAGEVLRPWQVAPAVASRSGRGKSLRPWNEGSHGGGRIGDPSVASMRTTLLRHLMAAALALAGAVPLLAQQAQTSTHGPFKNDTTGGSNNSRNALTVEIKDQDGSSHPGNPYVSGVVVKNKSGNLRNPQPTEGAGADGKPGPNQYLLLVDGDRVTIWFGTAIGPGETVDVKVTRDAGTNTPNVKPVGGQRDNGYTDRQ